ncbi:MAG: peptidase S41, partial [Porphyromonadaceae bacterium]|nr:peptidase S41 [Porphyromonadaceae bacterium]
MYPNKFHTAIVTFLIIFGMISCSMEEEFPQTPYGNFDALWTILDQRYCFFSYKDIDWDEIYT